MRLSPYSHAHSPQHFARVSRIICGQILKCGSRLCAAHIRFKPNARVWRNLMIGVPEIVLWHDFVLSGRDNH
eukprot:814015-Pyramimonas_sp.AAC.1